MKSCRDSNNEKLLSFLFPSYSEKELSSLDDTDIVEVSIQKDYFQLKNLKIFLNKAIKKWKVFLKPKTKRLRKNRKSGIILKYPNSQLPVN